MKSINPLFTTRHLVASGLLVMACGGSTQAADRSWTGATDTSWGSTTNWTPTGAPISSDWLYFDANSTANLNTTLGATNYSIVGIAGTSGLTSDVSIASTGGVLTFNSNGIDWRRGVTKNLSISADVAVTSGGNQYWWAESGTKVSLSGKVAINTYVLIRGSGTISSAVTTGTTEFSNDVTVASGKAVYVADGGYDGNMAITDGIFDSTASANWFVGQGSGISDGVYSNGTLTISGSGHLKYSTGNILYVGNSSATGTVTISGSGILEAATYTQTIMLGREGGTGTLNLDGGTLFTSRSIRGSNSGAGTGTFNFNGGTLKAKDGNNANWLLSASTFNAYVKGNDSTADSGAVFDTNGYNMGTSVALQHAAGPAIDGGLTKKGAGTLTLSGINTYTGVTTINAGTLALGHATNTLLDAGALTVNGATAVLSIGANSDTVGAVSLKNGGQITGSGGTLSGASYAMESGSVSAKLGGSAALTKSTSGTVTLSGANTYSGATTINGGKLTIGSTGTINSTSGVSIAAGEFNYNSTTALNKGVSFSGTGGTLSGSGTIDLAVIVTNDNIQTAGSSVMATNPSATLGKQTFTTGITYNQGSIFEWNLTANSDSSTGVRETNYDAINTGGLATSGSGAIFRVVLNGSQNFSEAFWNTTRTWSDIFTNVAGTTNLNIASIFGGGVQYWNSTGNLGTPTTQGYFTMSTNTLTWTAVPEPTSALAGVLLGAGLLRRRRR